MSALQQHQFDKGLFHDPLAANIGAGWLRDLTDMVVTPRLSLEQRKDFVAAGDLSGTIGLVAAGADLLCFGTGDAAPANLPATIRYQKLSHPSDASQPLSRILDSASFKGRAYVIAQFGDDSIHHFYDGARVSDWDNILSLGDINDWDDLIDHFQAELSTDPVCSVARDGMSLILTAGQPDAPMVVTASLTNGGAHNDQKVVVDLAHQAPEEAAEHQVKITFSGTYEKDDVFRISIDGRIYKKNGNAQTMAKLCGVAGTKLYAAADHQVFFCAVEDPTDWKGRDDGDGFISLYTHPGGDQPVTAIAPYRNGLAFFSRDAVMIWTLDPDPARDRREKTLTHTGCIAPQSVQDLADREVFFLAENGVKSLRRNLETDKPEADLDVGHPVNLLINQHDLADRQQAKSIIDPASGHYWLWIDQVIYVFASSNNPRIAAWSRFLPGMNCQALCPHNGRVWVRSGDQLFLYGGAGDDQYGGVPRITTPFYTAPQADVKFQAQYVELISQGDWQLDLIQNYDDSVISHLGLISGTTVNQGRHNLMGYGPFLSMRLTAIAGSKSPHLLGKFIVVYQKGNSG